MKVTLDIDNGDAVDLAMLIHLSTYTLDMFSVLVDWNRGVHGCDGLLDPATKDALEEACAKMKAFRSEVDRQILEFYDKRVVE